jgi:hypothetical protein
MAIDKLKGHKSSGIDEISGEMITALGSTIRSEINKFFNSTPNK